MYRMKTRVLIFLFMLCSLSLDAQIRLEGYRQTDINPELLTGRWKAHWISMPGEPANVYGVYHMRKTFELDEVPSRFIVHVSHLDLHVGISITGILKRSIWLLT